MVSRLDLQQAMVPRLTDRLVDGMAEASHCDFQDVYHSMMSDPPPSMPWEKVDEQHKIALRAGARAAYQYLAVAGGACVVSI